MRPNTSRAGRVLFFTLTDQLYGGERCLIEMLKALPSRSEIDPLVVVPGEGRLTKELERTGIAWVVRGLSEASEWWRLVDRVVDAARWFRKMRASVVYFNAASYWRPIEIAVASAMRIPVVTHHHVVSSSVPPFHRYSDLVIANSRYVAARLPVRNAVILDNPVDIGAFNRATASPEEYGLRAGEVSIFFVGQIKPIKGVDVFLDAMEIVAHEHLDVRFVLIGDTLDVSYARHVRSRVAKTSCVRWFGFQRQIERAYATADVVVMPSSWDEPFGRIVIEAGAAGKPIIATNVGGVPEILGDGVNGLMVPRDDPIALASAMRTLLQDGELRVRLGREGRRLAERRFAASVVAGQLEELLVGLMH